MRGIKSDSMKMAARWFSRVRGAAIPEHEDRALSSWIRDEIHQHAYESTALAWELVEDIKTSAVMQQWLRQLDVEISTYRRRREKLLPWSAAVAAIVLAVTGLLLWWPATPTQYGTALGEQKKLILDDGSRVTLTANSSMKVQLKHALREVTLARGGAHFKVAKDSARPFEVFALKGVTHTAGAEFDVQLGSESATVTVIEGAVLVRGNGQRNDGASANVNAGQVVEYTTQGALFDVRDTASAKTGAWRASSLGIH